MQMFWYKEEWRMIDGEVLFRCDVFCSMVEFEEQL